MIGIAAERITGFRSRLGALTGPESVVAAAVLVAWTLAFAVVVPPPLLLVALLVSAALHVSVIDTGSYVVLSLAAAWMLALVAMTIRAVGDVHPLLVGLAGLTVLAYDELVRLALARRRDAVIDSRVRRGSIVGLGLVGLMTLIVIGVAEPLAEGPVRIWWWVPAVGGVLLAVAVAFAVLPVHRRAAQPRDRWQPGERIPPPGDTSPAD